MSFWEAGVPTKRALSLAFSEVSSSMLMSFFCTGTKKSVSESQQPEVRVRYAQVSKETYCL